MNVLIPGMKQKKRRNPFIHPRGVEGISRRLLMIEGKFLHGTRGKPGRSAHGDKYY